MKVSYTVILEYLISVFFIHEEKPFYKIFLNYSNLTLKILIKPYNMIFFYSLLLYPYFCMYFQKTAKTMARPCFAYDSKEQPAQYCQDPCRFLTPKRKFDQLVQSITSPHVGFDQFI